MDNIVCEQKKNANLTKQVHAKSLLSLSASNFNVQSNGENLQRFHRRTTHKRSDLVLPFLSVNKCKQGTSTVAVHIG